MKLTAQMSPVGPSDSQVVRLQFRDGGEWQTVADATIHPESRTATFRLEKWDATKVIPYRLAYTFAESAGGEKEYYWTGTVRRDPVASV